MKRACERLYFCVAYYVSWLVFGIVGLALNAASALLLPWRRSPAVQRHARAVLRTAFDLWLRCLHALRVLTVDWRGFPAELSPGTVYIANHPSLIDAALLLARIPDAICIFKPILARNPVIGPAALLAGYAAGDTPLSLVRDVSGKLARGQSLLVFPEGTRTARGSDFGPLKAGFALMATQAGVPVQLITIQTSPGLLRRGEPAWCPPRVLPARVVLHFDRRWAFDPARSARELLREVEDQLQGRKLAPVE